MKLTLSVVIPIFNGEKYIERAVISVLNQEKPPFTKIEIILVNDGSRDNSYKIITRLVKEFDNISLIDLEKNHGVAHARNLGIKAAKTEWLAFLDQDDQWHPQKLALQFAFLNQNLSYKFVLSKQVFNLERQTTMPYWFKKRWLESPQPGYVFGCLLIRKEYFLAIK